MYSLRPFRNGGSCAINGLQSLLKHSASAIDTHPRALSCAFSTSRNLLKKPHPNQKRDTRITLIRYHLQHPITPRPLRFSRLRGLRHWTIHRAWQLFRAKQNRDRELSLERQYNSMRSACEALRLIGEEGLAVQEGSALPPPGARDLATATVETKDGKKIELDVLSAAQGQRDIGRLYRIAMQKKGIWEGVPIEYARSQTDTPRRDGWEHDWTR